MARGQGAQPVGLFLDRRDDARMLVTEAGEDQLRAEVQKAPAVGVDDVAALTADDRPHSARTLHRPRVEDQVVEIHRTPRPSIDQPTSIIEPIAPPVQANGQAGGRPSARRVAQESPAVDHAVFASRTAIAEVGIGIDVFVRSDAKSSMLGLWPTRTTVRASSGRSRTTLSRDPP
jgi:hypothetical protein